MVEIIPKKPKKLLPWENISFYVSLALLLAVILSYTTLIYFEIRASASLKELEGQIFQVGGREDKALEAEVFNHKRKIGDFSALLDGRHLSANFFGNFEKMVHPKVWFSDFALDPIKIEAVLSGHTPGFQTLDQQLNIFKNQEVIKEVNLSKLSIGKEGDAEFTVSLSFKPEIFTTIITIATTTATQ